MRALLTVVTAVILGGAVLSFLASRSVYASIQAHTKFEFNNMFDKCVASVAQMDSEDSKQLKLLGWVATTGRALTFPEHSSVADMIAGDTNVTMFAWAPRVQASARGTVESNTCTAVLNATGCTLTQVRECLNTN